MNRRLTTNGAEDIDEVVAQVGRVDFHVERMSTNEYMVSFGKGDGQILLFIGHWPRNKRKQGKLFMNVTENGIGAELRRV